LAAAARPWSRQPSPRDCRHGARRQLARTARNAPSSGCTRTPTQAARRLAGVPPGALAEFRRRAPCHGHRQATGRSALWLTYAHTCDWLARFPITNTSAGWISANGHRFATVGPCPDS
jgi:hypothetical protein